MHVFRKRAKRDAERRREHTPDPTYNPFRDEYLYSHTSEGYIIAYDIASQNEYVDHSSCEECGGQLAVIAVLNRAGQGLSEMVAFCRDCKTRTSFLFDISNEVYQSWWADQLGDLYIQQYDGPSRVPASVSASVYDEE